MKTQMLKVLRALQKRPLTPLDALRDLGVGRLAARVQELSEAGYPVVTERIAVPTRAGEAVVARYRLVEESS